jgi:acyl-CoA carboxylase subunit beta
MNTCEGEAGALQEQPNLPTTSSNEQIESQILPPKSGYLPNPLEAMLWQRPSVDAGDVLARVKGNTKFDEREREMRLIHDLIGMIRHHPGGRRETYFDKLQKEEAKGHPEAASYGVAEMHGKDFVLFANHWDFFAGSAGVVVGEKFVNAAGMAADKKIPLVGYYSSSGIRQQENYPGLLQMQRMVNAVADYRRKNREPYIAVLSHQVWGGISASVIPLADVSVGIAGTNYGFSGPNVIKSYENKEVPEGAQSVEANVLNRNIDFLVRDELELNHWLDNLMHHSHFGKSGRLTPEAIKQLPEIEELSRAEGFSFDKYGFSSLISDPEQLPASQGGQIQEAVVYEQSGQDNGDLYERYQSHIRNPNRPDSEY